MTSQLERDLERRTRDRLGTWAKDTFALYEMAGLERGEGEHVMLSTLIHFLAHMLDFYGANPEEAAEMLRKSMKYSHKVNAVHKQ
jgi:hypothetical protein